LRKRFEDRLELFLGNADTGIANHEMQESETAVVFLAGHLQRHFPLAGEFDRVADQVENDLAEPRRVGVHHLRHIGRHFEQQAQALLIRANNHRFHGRLEFLAHIEIEVIQIQLSRFHLREIENIVDQAE
jgi:hypothetical protein